MLSGTSILTDYGPSQELSKLQLENQDLRRELNEARTEQEQTARAKKKTSKRGSKRGTSPEDDDDDDPLLQYEAPSHVFGLMGNAWVTRAMLQRPCPPVDPNSLARYDDDTARADGDSAELYEAFPEALRPGILQHGHIRARVSVYTCSYSMFLYSSLA